MSLSQKIVDWTYFGTAYTTHETEKRHIIFSNIIFLTLPIVYLVFILIDIKSFFDTTSILKFDRLVVPIIITLCIFFLFLNKWGLTTLSRVLFLISWILMLHILPIIIHQSPTDYYLALYKKSLSYVETDLKRLRYDKDSGSLKTSFENLEVGNYLIKELSQIPQITEIRGRGLMIGIELSEDYANVKKDLLFKHRIFTGEAKPNVIRLLPALNITKEHADQFLTAFKAELN